jgi:outer membrane protein assembly factor BamB
MPQCAYGAGQVFCARAGAAFALSAADGKLLWHRSAAGPVCGPPVAADSLVQFCTGRGSVLTARDPHSGDEVWRRLLPDGAVVRYAGGTALVTGADGTVTGVDGRSGRTKWHRRLPGYSTPSLASFAGDPLAYAITSSQDGAHTHVAAVDPDTGAVRWEASLGGVLNPVGSQGGSLFFLSADTSLAANAVVRYTPASKASRRVALPVPRLSPQATAHGDTVYLLSAGGSLEAVDLAAGKPLWHLETSVSRGSAPVADGAHVYFTAADGRLLAVDARGGRLVGQTPARLGADAGVVTADLPAPLVVDGHVYAGAPDGTVFGVAARDPGDW